MLGATVVKHNQNAEQDNKSFTRFVLCMYVNCVDATLSVTHNERGTMQEKNVEISIQEKCYYICTVGVLV